jgi:uncharacterized protein YqeY
MPLVEKLQNDLKESMRAKDSVRLNTLRMLKSAVMYATTDAGSAQDTPDDETVLQAARKEIKKRDDAIESFRKAGREEQAAQEEAEKAILQEYLPPALSDDELKALVDAAIKEAGATSRKEMGAVMKILAQTSGGRADGKTLSQAVQAALN